MENVRLGKEDASIDEVQEAISNLSKGKTVVVIAHRLRTIESADKITQGKEKAMHFP